MKGIKKILIVIIVFLGFAYTTDANSWSICQDVYGFTQRSLGPNEYWTNLEGKLLVSVVDYPNPLSEPCYLKKGTEVAVKDLGDQYCIVWAKVLGRDVTKPGTFERYCWGKAPAEREGLEREEEEPGEAEGVIEIEQSMSEQEPPTIIIEPIDNPVNNPAPEPTIIIEPIPGRAKFEVKKTTAQQSKQQSKPETTLGSTVTDSPTPPPPPKKSISKIWLLIGVLIGGIGVSICSFFKRKR